MKKLFLLLEILWGVVAFAQPTGTCTTGATQLGTDGILYGCVEGNWKRLSEWNTATNPSVFSSTQGITQNVGGGVYVREMNNSVRDLRNVHFEPITLTGHAHAVGKIIYDSTSKHFYQGVQQANKWHRIDNGAIYPAGSIGGYLLVSPDPTEGYAFAHYFEEDQSCDDPELLGRIIGKLQELAEQQCLYLHPRDRGKVVAVHFEWGRDYPEPNPCGFVIESQTISFGCGGIGL